MDNRDPWAPPPDRPGERPRAEPEIIPPGAPDPRFRPDPSRIWVSMGGASGRRRVYIGRPGPFAIALALIGLGLFAAAVLVLLFGLFLLWIPIAGAVAGAVLLSALLRGAAKRLR